MNRIKVEYLVIISTVDSFCSTKKAFNNLLSSYGDIAIVKNKLKYKTIETEYEVQTREVEKGKQRLFHLTITCNDELDLEIYSNLLKRVRGILFKVTNKQLQKLWDDRNLYYSEKAYPLIHEIENLMRKLITKFMLTNVGLGWEKGAIPNDVIKSRKTKSENSNYLYEVDFIQLEKFMFIDYEVSTTEKLFDIIRKSDSIEKLSLTELKSFIPRSNWKRYFSSIVSCEDGFLQKKWKKLYEYRCKIAHNNDFTKEDYEETEQLYTEVKEILCNAIKGLDTINVTEEEKEDIAENIIISTNELYGRFIKAWNQFANVIYIKLKQNPEKVDIDKMSNKKDRETIKLKGIDGIRYSMSILGRVLIDSNMISKRLHERIEELFFVRNEIIFNSEISFDKSFLESKINEIESLKIACISEIEKSLEK